MKKLHLLLAGIGLITAASLSTAYAENRPGTLSARLGGGYHWFANKRHMDDHGFVQTGLGWNFTQNWGVEAVANFFNTHFKDSVNDSREITSRVYTFDVIYHMDPMDYGLTPYAMLGANLTTLNPNRTDSHDEGGMNGGLGLQYFVHKSVALYVEGKDIYTFRGGKNDVEAAAGVNVLFDFC